jgi:hypothetical protein
MMTSVAGWIVRAVLQRVCPSKMARLHVARRAEAVEIGRSIEMDLAVHSD